MKTTLRLSMLLLLGVLAHDACSAQSALYKSYVNRPGVEAVCITNYPVGNGISTAVTTLRFQDSALLKQVLLELLALPYSADKTGSREKDFDSFLRLTRASTPLVGDTLPIQSLTKALSEVQKIEGRVVAGKEASQNLGLFSPATTDSLGRRQLNFTFFVTDPLPGDSGVYQVVHSSLMKTIIVFLCPTPAVREQVTRYVLKHAAKSLQAEEREHIQTYQFTLN